MTTLPSKKPNNAEEFLQEGVAYSNVKKQQQQQQWKAKPYNI